MKKENLLFTLLLSVLILFPTAFAIFTHLDSLRSHLPSIFPNARAQDNESNPDIAQGELYVGNGNSSNISVIDLATDRVNKNITVGSGTHDIKISDDQLMVYTTDIDSGTISIVNTTSNELMNNVTTDVSVHGIAEFNDTLYVGDVYGGKVLVIKDATIKDEIKLVLVLNMLR